MLFFSTPPSEPEVSTVMELWWFYGPWERVESSTVLLQPDFQPEESHHYREHQWEFKCPLNDNLTSSTKLYKFIQIILVYVVYFIISWIMILCCCLAMRWSLQVDLFFVLSLTLQTRVVCSPKVLMILSFRFHLKDWSFLDKSTCSSYWQELSQHNFNISEEKKAIWE